MQAASRRPRASRAGAHATLSRRLSSLMRSALPPRRRDGARARSGALGRPPGNLAGPWSNLAERKQGPIQLFARTLGALPLERRPRTPTPTHPADAVQTARHRRTRGASMPPPAAPAARSAAQRVGPNLHPLPPRLRLELFPHRLPLLPRPPHPSQPEAATPRPLRLPGPARGRRAHQRAGQGRGIARGGGAATCALRFGRLPHWWLSGRRCVPGAPRGAVRRRRGELASTPRVAGVPGRSARQGGAVAGRCTAELVLAPRTVPCDGDLHFPAAPAWTGSAGPSAGDDALGQNARRGAVFAPPSALCTRALALLHPVWHVG